MQKTVEWYKANEDWWRNVKSGEYQKYYEKQYKQQHSMLGRPQH
jgi:dTDP-glucose 4,6-dehydratase